MQVRAQQTHPFSPTWRPLTAVSALSSTPLYKSLCRILIPTGTALPKAVHLSLTSSKMSSFSHFALTTLCVLSLLLHPSAGVPRKLAALVQQQPLVLKYHNGLLLKGNYTLNLVWYGSFAPTQRSIIVDFLQSLAHDQNPSPPSVAQWWKTIEKYKAGPSNLLLGTQILEANYPLGKSLKSSDVVALATKAGGRKVISIVFTAKDVAVEGFCMSRCGTHGSVRGPKGSRLAYAWVGNSELQCPGQCAWPFHQPIYGPQTPPLVAPNGEVGVDGMIINVATMLANTVTNPFAGGYFQGPANAPLEAVSACTGVFGKGAYPGYPGEVLVDKSTGASYNARGVNGRKYLLPAMWDPKSSACSTLV
ncbi:Protein EXORDIUM-like 2 [Asimina triloba]